LAKAPQAQPSLTNGQTRCAHPDVRICRVEGGYARPDLPRSAHLGRPASPEAGRPSCRL
jgi:hypothetical protein